MPKELKIKDFEMIDAELVPQKGRRGKVKWEKLFKKIPHGKAIIIEKAQLSPATVREALKRFQEKGRFKDMYTTTRKVGEGKYVTYVVNAGEEKEQGID